MIAPRRRGTSAKSDDWRDSQGGEVSRQRANRPKKKELQERAAHGDRRAARELAQLLKAEAKQEELRQKAEERQQKYGEFA